MEIENTLILPAPPDKVWSLLLDPQVMAQCVPGMQSVEVISPDEYTAEIVTKVSFITARMKLRTRIVERDEPKYLKAEGTGEDSGVASSMKQTTEMHLHPMPDGQTQLQLKVKIDVVGRLATFGLSALKTKADRMWDEFGKNLLKHLQIEAGATTVGERLSQATHAIPVASASEPITHSLAPAAVRTQEAPTSRSWWQRLMGGDSDRVIVVDWQRSDGSRVRVQWPVQQADACTAWLNQLK